jgi:hypothetical protein
VKTLTRSEWRALYDAWRKPYAHLPKPSRRWVVKGCMGKALYETREEAEKLAATLPPRGDLACSVYPCDICSHFHIGNTKGQPSTPNRIIEGHKQ